MRPLRLEVSGFTAFREPVTIDFDGVDFFALVGPTGSGKTSVIDAMTFALYGTVPRLDGRTVAPVITQGQLEAKIRFDFALGEDRYTAVRVVRRTPQGATTKEARLERAGGEVVAGDADAVTRAAEDLLGLTYEHFTKCVVLPQGEFARFLHDKPSTRQDLLVRLLDLGVYSAMAQRANLIAGEAAAQATLLRRRLTEDLAFATEDARDEARGRITRLEALRDRIETEAPQLEELREAMRLAKEQVEAAQRRVLGLRSVAVPHDVEDLAAELQRTTQARELGEQAIAGAEEQVRKAEKTLGELPELGPLEAARAAHEQRGTCATEHAAAADVLAAATRAEKEAERTVERASAQAQEAEAALESLRIQHRAHALVGSLRVGEPCPVCRHPVEELPADEVPPALKEAERALERARAARTDAERAHTEARRAHAKAEERLAALTDQLAAYDERVKTHPDPTALGALIEQVRAAGTALEAARKEEQNARNLAAAAQRALEAARKRQAAAAKQLDAARDAVAELGPPLPGREDLAADWEALAAWAAEQAQAQEEAGAAAKARAADAEQQGRALLAQQLEACREAGIDDPRVPRDDCLKALERARGQLERIELALDEVERVRGELSALDEQEQVAKALAKHLGARNFERWVLEEAVRMLLEGATQNLLELSNGQYSLAMDQHGNFTVIDHRNANETRPARTLSGGETFLASLALALALSDRIAELSAKTAVRLESIFLDEGFGTLDPETLDTVAAAIEGLAGGARVVGIVTHVRDLAERVPVRFEVRKGPETSTVEKVLA